MNCSLMGHMNYMGTRLSLKRDFKLGASFNLRIRRGQLPPFSLQISRKLKVPPPFFQSCAVLHGGDLVDLEHLYCLSNVKMIP